MDNSAGGLDAPDASSRDGSILSSGEASTPRPCSLPATPAPSPQRPFRILAIDQGEIHFGLCLAEYDGRIVRPLFLGAAYLEPTPLAALVEDRAARRRVRRTAREHRRRLKRLRDLLGGRGGALEGQPDLVQAVAAFCKRRGHFYADEGDEKEAQKGDAVPHQEFLRALDDHLARLISDPARREAVTRVCTSVLSRRSRRPMRVDARKVGVCQWAGCTSRRAKVGVGSLVQGLAGKLRPFLEAGVLAPQSVLDLARTALETPEAKPAVNASLKLPTFARHFSPA